MIDLPSKLDGKPKISYSQMNTFTSNKCFNLGAVHGMYEYFQKYFLKKRFPDEMGWGEFGNKVEDSIETQDFSKFSEKEAKILKQIKPLPVFQKELIVDFGDFVAQGFLDNCTEDMSHIIDFKTASENSVKQYYSKDYKQLLFYAFLAWKKTGNIPESVKVVAILRDGNPYKGEKLTVADKPPRYIPIEFTEKDLEDVEVWMYNAVSGISEYYKIFKELNR